MKILLLGGNGYIGSSLHKTLLSRGHNAFSTDACFFDKNLGYSHKLDYKYLSKFDLVGYSHIILLAGHSSVPLANQDPVGALNNNVNNFIELVSKLSSHQTFIYASSSSVYGNSKEDKHVESNTNFSACNPYDISKSLIDYYMQFFDLEYYGLRFATVCGPSEYTREDLMINKMVKDAKTYNKITVYKDIQRPILDILDLNNAICTIIDKGSYDKRGIYNLSSFNSSSHKMGKFIAKEIGCKLEIIDVKENSYNFSLDSTKFSKTFNFRFMGTLDSITKNLVDNFYDTKFVTRTNSFKYGKI